MADLKLEVAVNLVGNLLAAGHPYQQSAINATALLLMKWCKGAIVNGVTWSPEQQATALVEEAGLWEGGWPDKGGPKQLLDLFRAKFKPVRTFNTFVELTAEEKAACDPANFCAECHGFGTRRINGLTQYCPCDAGQAFAVQCGGQEWLDRINRPAGASTAANPVTRASIEQLLAHAQENLEDEQRRKAEQLARVGCD
jgi:hypothetical protein